jgi:histone acetyltransferase
VGYIKDYDGGTLMECYIHPAMDYMNVNNIVKKQRAFIMQRVLERSQ